MNFVKWFTFLLALGLYTWYVFFRNDIADAAYVSNTTEDVVDSITDDSNTDNVDDESFVDETSGVISEDDAGSEGVFDDTPAVVNEDPVVEETVVEQPVNTSSGFDWNQKYYIVVGSFGSSSNAKKMQQRVINDGHKAEIKKIKGLNRVIVETTDDRTNARQVRDHFTRIYKETAFILEN